MTEIVIKITDEDYEEIKQALSVSKLFNLDVKGMTVLNAISAIKNGKVLPKGHGGLVDGYRVIKALHNHEAVELPFLVDPDKYFKAIIADALSNNHECPPTGGSCMTDD